MRSGANKLDLEIQEVVETIKAKRPTNKEGPAAKTAKVAKLKCPEDADFNLGSLQALAPSKGKIWYDPRGERYQIWYEGSSCSRSCARYGEAEAARLVLKWAWTCEALFSDALCPHDGIFV